MLPNAFIGQTRAPSRAELAAALGPALAAWDRLLGDLATEAEVTVHEWRSYSPKHGWSLRAMRQARTILWLSPFTGAFQVGCILGPRAVAAAHRQRLPRVLVTALATAPRYPEGTGVRLTLRTLRQLSAAKTLARIKLAY